MNLNEYLIFRLIESIDFDITSFLVIKNLKLNNMYKNNYQIIINIIIIINRY